MNTFQTIWRAITVFLLVLGVIAILADLENNAYLLFTSPLCAWLCYLQAKGKNKNTD